MNSSDANKVALVFANEPNNVANVHLTFADGAVTSDWYASRIQLGAEPIVTLTSRPEAPPRPNLDIDFAKLAHILIELSDGRDIIVGAKPQATPVAEDPRMAAAQLANDGERLRLEGKLREAEPALVRALGEVRRAFPASDPNVARAISSLATVYFDLGDYPRAHPLFREAIDVYRAQSPSSTDLAEMLNSLGLIELRSGNLEIAEPLFRQSLEMYRALGDQRSRGYARALHNLAVRYGQGGNFAGAGPLFQEALDLRRALFGDSNPETLESLASFGTFWLVQGNIANAEPLFRRALGLTRQILGEEHLTTAERFMDVALCIKQKRTFESAKEAEPLIRQAFGIRRARLGDAHPATQFAQGELTAVQRALGIS